MSIEVLNSNSTCRRTAKFRQYLAAILVSLLGLCLGSTVGWTSPMQPLLTSDNPPFGTEPLTMDTVSWLGSINYFGAIAGTFFWGRVADRLGRKTAASLVAVPFIVGWTLILVAQQVWWLVVARFVIGIGATGTIVAVPFFISEMAEDKVRGFFGSFLSMFVFGGILYSYIIGAYLKYHGLAILGLAVPVVFAVTFIWLPETPVFLWKNGEEEKAEKSLLWYRGGDKVMTDKELWRLKDLTKEQIKRPNLKSLVATKGTRKALIIGIALWVSKIGSGMFPILSFAVNIFEMCDTSLTPYQAAIMMATMQLISGIFCSALVERLGRKMLVVGSLMTIAITLTVLGAYLTFIEEFQAYPILKWVPVVCLCLHVIALGVGIGPMAFVVSAEIFPPEIRGLAMSKLQLLFSTLAFATIKMFPWMKFYLKPQGCFWFYGLSSFIFSLFFCFYLPETKGRTQNAILRLLNGEDPNEDVSVEEMKQLNKEGKVIKS
ncbi:facilitated trehalose transporter Tret1-like [Macrosteles quadrilineatus]|uniref:facilitated trehalose transporter Tret1-like n=1 Tax=Macrosteles quadrilineatus TaxID=74068 RepID=UPI0023E11C67|nr:facilitated trehalose transporter Tret1-like [Macrosteles quadrilineatus]